jgi:hypothetical protein
MTKKTRDRLILIGGLLIIGLYLSRNVIKEIFSRADSAKTKNSSQGNYANDIIGKWTLDKNRTILYKEKPNYQMGGNIVEIGKYILERVQASELEFKPGDEYRHKVTGYAPSDTSWIEGEWSIDDNKLVLAEKKNGKQDGAGLSEDAIRPSQHFEWHYRILQLDNSSLLLLVHHRKPNYINGHVMEVNDGDTLFYRSQR